MKVFKSEKGKKRLLASYDRLAARWGVPVQERDIPTRYGSTHVLLAGDAALPPLTLFHGVGDNSALMWLFNAAAWARSFRLIAVDTLGGPGKSVPGPGYGREFDQLLWIDDTLDGLGVTRTHVAGVSNGAYLAQFYAANRPGRTDRVVCMAGSLAAGPDTSPAQVMLRMMKVFLPEALFPTRRNMKRLIGKMMGENAPVFTGDAELMEQWTCLLRCFNQRAMAFHRLRPLTDAQADELRERALFLIGREDPLGNTQNAQANLRRYGMRYELLDGTGHGINHERSYYINERVAAHLLRQAPPAVRS